MGTCTIGVSIAVPEPYGSLLQRRRAGFGDPQAWRIPTHVTLLPPTEVGTEALSGIEAHLAGVAAIGRVFEIWLDGTDTFRPLSPVVFVRLVRGAEECRRLQERVRSGPLRRDLAFPYHPHVTIAHGVPDDALDQAHAELARFRAAWATPGFALYQQGADGVWRQIREYRFPAPALPHQPEAGQLPTSARG
ncbi:phosphoesterase [Wenjunlia vitaminophila]|uniref:Phosphoesterase n=1 Tax=Wenjunlia vitaminophila TaxID=76728 RepID=A0A0T6LLX8_WENVI|nr:2'-5' RNA ligase family protein [Wenjunlia vitaminophila]KRV46895.1 phosphoesterase [Wenjunlia vitaminophila]